MQGIVDDLQFVLTEVERTYETGIRQVLQDSPLAMFATLPHPSGRGVLFCGVPAYRRLEDVARRAVAASDYPRSIDIGEVLKELRASFVERFIRLGRVIDQREGDRTVAAAVRKAAKRRITTTHYIPCHLGHSETSVDIVIGPVRIRPASTVLSELHQIFEENVRNNAQISAEKYLHVAQEHYATFGWTAEITIPNCDAPTSRRRADRITQSALDCIHLLLGGPRSHHMKMGGMNFSVDRRGRIRRFQSGELDVSISTDWRSNILPEGWWDQVCREIGPETVELMGVALSSANADNDPPPLAQRFLDAAAWYGEAVRDPFPASRMVKYVTAMERILTTGNSDINKTIAERGSALLYNPSNPDIEGTAKRFSDVYDLRSRLVHGSLSPHSKELAVGLQMAEELARFTVVRVLEFYELDGLQASNASDSSLNSGFERLIDWASGARS